MFGKNRNQDGQNNQTASQNATTTKYKIQVKNGVFWNDYRKGYFDYAAAANAAMYLANTEGRSFKVVIDN